METGTDVSHRTAGRPGRWIAIGLGCGLVGFALTGTFHWAYLAMLGGMFWLAMRDDA